MKKIHENNYFEILDEPQWTLKHTPSKKKFLWSSWPLKQVLYLYWVSLKLEKVKNNPWWISQKVKRFKSINLDNDVIQGSPNPQNKGFLLKKHQTYTNTLSNHIYFRDLLHIDQWIYKLNLNTHSSNF